ncbi:metallophosphoesterase [Rhizobiaceae bacterium CRRU44]|uniref:Metallophosphoesterase n=1 Tax=Ferranicluibacter rubi TaxID=2715133 RepID=A0AA44CCK0_9HYPH|nr:metallophosphoesterase [Ferranicluibacter rubi]NHT78335.1 metallophosphoesterase [Ferranicluibacter rubi]
MFHLIFGLPWLVVLVRFIQPLPWLWSVKALLAIVLLLASQYHFFSRLSSGSVFSPEFPRWLVIGFNLLFGAIALLAVLQIALDLVSLLLALIKGRLITVPPGIRYAMGATALAAAAIGVSQAIRVPPLKSIEIAIPNLPPSFDGYRMLQLTDMHISRLFPQAWAEAVVERSNALAPDVIVITGDLIDGSLEDRRADVAPLAKLKARDGVIAIPGNHEYFFGYAEWMAHFASLGMRLLENQHTTVTRDNASITIAGVTDLSARAHDLPGPDLAKALEGAPADTPIILLDHQPREAARAAAAGVALQLSGHTHGGLILGLDRLFARPNNGFVSGLYTVGGLQLYVNNGTGLWPGFALRLGRPSELTVITFRRTS